MGFTKTPMEFGVQHTAVSSGEQATSSMPEHDKKRPRSSSQPDVELFRLKCNLREASWSRLQVQVPADHEDLCVFLSMLPLPPPVRRRVSSHASPIPLERAVCDTPSS